MEVAPGSRWKSAVCETEVIVVRPPSAAVDLRCGGHAMVPLDGEAPGGLDPDPDHADGTAMGKRFVDEASGIELLCTKPGAGSLSLGDTKLVRKDAKPLPSSD